MADKRFGLWTVLSRAGNLGKKTMWLCRCACGKERVVQATNLRVGKSTSCGCVSGIKNRKRPYEALYNILLKKARTDVAITYEEFVVLTTINECVYCGIEVKWAEYHPSRFGSGYNLDRKDNNKIYIKGNVVVCCGRCNRVKGSLFTYEQFLEIGKLIRKWEGR